MNYVNSKERILERYKNDENTFFVKGEYLFDWRARVIIGDGL